MADKEILGILLDDSDSDVSDICSNEKIDIPLPGPSSAPGHNPRTPEKQDSDSEQGIKQLLKRRQ